MKHLLLFPLLFIITSSFAQNTTQIENTNPYLKFGSNKIEDKNGHLITDSITRLAFFTKRQEEINFHNKSKSSKKTLGQTPVQICSNGGFEEFETISNNTILKDFKYGIGYPQNPIQCKSVSLVADENIKQYDPNNFGLMISTVPANFLDEYIGNINAFDQFALKINYKESSLALGVVQAKRFKTNNEKLVKFNYKAILQSITGSDHLNEQPYFKARILNKNGTVVSEFCAVGDPTNCIFTQASDLEGGSIVLYTKNWQNGTLDISSIPNNEEFTIEFMGSRCGLSGHFGYAYVDDICFLHSSENSQGSIELEPLNKVCPTMPISVCGNYTVPNSGGISASVSSITLNVYDEAHKAIYTTSTPLTLDLSNNKFCFELKKTELPNTTNGNYNIGVTINYGITQTTCSGTSFNSATDDDANPGWDISFMNCTSSCNFTIESGNLELCDTNKDGKEFFDLTTINSQVTGNQTGLTFSYFTNQTEASNNTNEIKNYTNYESASATLFVRVSKNTSCFKIIAINLIVKNPVATILGSLNICGGSTTLTASQGLNYLWSNGEKTQSIAVSSTGTYTLEITDASGCISNASITIPTNQIAAQPTIAVTQPNCFVNTGTVSITSDASEYSFDGGNTWTTNSTMSNLAVGEYLIKVKTALGCISYNTKVTINPFYLSFPNYTSINPLNCNDFGSITITTNAFEYSFDDGITWVKNNTATNLPSGTYNIRTKNQFGCISSFNTVTLNSQFIQAPYCTSIQPKCNVGGTITISTAATEYSFDNGQTWTTNPIKTGLDSGVYYIVIKNNIGCISYSQYVNLEPYYLPSPSYTTIQPKCGAGGTIAITTKAAGYSFDNGVTWTANPVMTNLAAGTYYIMIKNNLGCTSNYQYVNLNNFYIDYPTYETVQPVCGAGGTITITTKAAEYSFDGGNTWTTNPVATNLPPNYYTILIKNDSGCISYSQYVSLNTFYLPEPSFTSIQPSCSAGGSITITTPANKYSFDGGNTWGTDPTASNLPPGYYTIMIKNNIGCISSARYAILDNFYLPAPSYNVVNPSCGNIGSITFTTIEDQYSFDNGTTWTTNPVATNLQPNYYYLKIKNKSGCESKSIGIYLDTYALANPNYTVTQPGCGTNGTIAITTIADNYSFDGGNTWTTNPVATNLQPNYYYLKIKNKSGCESYSSGLYLTPFYLDNPTYTITQPICGTGGSITIDTKSDYYSFDNGNTWSTNPTSSNLSAGYYVILIKNNQGCTSNYQYAYLNPAYLDKPAFTVDQPTCGKGGSISITTVSDYYSFDNGNTWTTNPVASNLTSGTYYIMIKNKLGCTSNYQYVSINKFYLDNPIFIIDEPTCDKGGSISITTVADKYSFDSGATWTTNPIATNLPSGYYNILVKNNLGCTSNYQYTFINPVYLDDPAFTVVNPTCTDTGSITITTIADKYSFDNGATWTTNPVKTNLSNNYYYLKIKNNTGCESKYQGVYINDIPYMSPKPNVTTISPSICGAKDGNITVTTNAVAYSFDNGQTWKTNPNSGPLEVGTYQIKIKENDWNCPSQTTSVLLNAIKNTVTAPSSTITQPDCSNPKGKITITTTASQYSFDDGLTWSSINISDYLKIGNYPIRIKNTDGCISEPSTASIVPFTNFPQTPIITNPQTFCIQQNATINDLIITGQNIKWYNALTDGSISLNTTSLQSGTTYYASQTINGCESKRASVQINIQNTSAPTGNTNQILCTSQNPTLKDIAILGTSLKWYDISGVILPNSTPLQDKTTYYATQTVNNCESITKSAFTISLINSLTANDYEKLICDDLNDGAEIINLADYNSDLISTPSIYNFTYFKSLSDAKNDLKSNQITSISKYSLVLGENKIYARITSDNFCYTIAELKLTLLPKPIIPIQNIVPICENKSILIDAGIGADSYLWSNGETTQSITVNNPENLSVTVTKNYSTISCSNTKAFAVKISNPATITNIQTQDWTDSENVVTVYTTGSGDYEYSIDGINYQDSNQLTGIHSGEYTVHVRDKNGCGTATEEVYLLMYPKFFTPNGDGFNDTWKIKSSDIEKGLIIKIFDRFGKLLKELDSNSIGWDGTYTGQTLPATDYWFAVTRANGKVYKGHFSLKR
jgi:gliding motility-associated-like protein